MSVKKSEGKIRGGFWYGVIASAVVIVVIAAIIFSKYDLVKEPGPARVDCELQKEFSSCGAVLAGLDAERSKLDDCSARLEDANEINIELNDKLASYDEAKKQELLKQAQEKDLLINEKDSLLKQCNEIRGNLENVCEGYVCKDGSIYYSGKDIPAALLPVTTTTSSDSRNILPTLDSLRASNREILDHHCSQDFQYLYDCVHRNS